MLDINRNIIKPSPSVPNKNIFVYLQFMSKIEVFKNQDDRCVVTTWLSLAGPLNSVMTVNKNIQTNNVNKVLQIKINGSV